MWDCAGVVEGEGYQGVFFCEGLGGAGAWGGDAEVGLGEEARAPGDVGEVGGRCVGHVGLGGRYFQSVVQIQ